MLWSLFLTLKPADEFTQLISPNRGKTTFRLLEEEMTIQFTGTDKMHTVLHQLSPEGEEQITSYTPYGGKAGAISAAPGFNGERRDLLTGLTHLGNGYRSYNPLLMRFQAPDSLSPFGKGGINSYAYCKGDPVNNSDPSGHMNDTDKASVGLGILGLVLGISMAVYSLSVASSLKATQSVIHHHTGSGDLLGSLADVASGSGAISHHSGRALSFHSAGHKKLSSMTGPAFDIIASATGIAGAVAHDQGQTQEARALGLISLTTFSASFITSIGEFRKLAKQRKICLSVPMVMLVLSTAAGAVHEGIALDDYFAESGEEENSMDSGSVKSLATDTGNSYGYSIQQGESASSSAGRLLALNRAAYPNRSVTQPHTGTYQHQEENKTARFLI